MPDPMQFVYAALGLFFLAQLITVHRGFANLFLRWRVWLKARNTMLYELFCCPYCLGVWIAIVPALVLAQDWLHWIPTWLALIGAQWFLQGGAGRENNDL